MRTPSGFTFAGVSAGIKPSRKDVALIHSDVPCAAAGCFTANKAKAAPILEAEGRLPASGMRAVLVNSGNANALTGPAGVQDVRDILDALGRELKVPASALLSASTGVIGLRLPAQKVIAALPQLVRNLGSDPGPAAEAIITTDTRLKMSWRAVRIGEREVIMSSVCKGSGMIAPQLATVIAVIVTDCAISHELLSTALRDAMQASFNNLTIDNDMSTNDAVLALANGKAKNSLIDRPGPELDLFTAALCDLCLELAKEIAADGEGATKVLEVQVTGAPDELIARDVARSITGSSLVKAAIFGGDPNWGRVLATVGARAGSQNFAIDPFQATVKIQGIGVYDKEPLPHDGQVLRGKMRRPEVKVEVDLCAGAAKATAWGCDLSYDYVKINADYTSMIIQTPEGGTARDDRLARYSPSFKVSLLVEALSYITRFTGKRCVIKYGGAAMVKESLKRSFCSDVMLLRSVGLQPVVVHGGGPEITKTLARLGRRAEFVEGVRLTDTTEADVMEMVLTGAINTGLVTLLNRDGGHAVGVSGKDGALFRAKQRVTESGDDLGPTGELTSINKGFLEMLLKQGYVPVISPVGLGEDGESFNINADDVASAVATAIGASKLIYLTDVPGILDGDELVSELTAAALQTRLEAGTIFGGMKIKAEAILEALEAGVERVHVLDGRTPHSVIAELFTDRGVGTLVTRA